MCITKCIPKDRWGLFITQVYGLKSGAWICGQKFTQDFSFKYIYFFKTFYIDRNISILMAALSGITQNVIYYWFYKHVFKIYRFY